MNCECEICKNHKPFVMPNDILIAARKGKLALFCGAGISTESKMVLPYSFYDDIRSELKISDDSLPFSELMQKYSDLPDGRRKLLKKIKERFEYIHSFPELENNATMFHRELAELYFIRTIITTNWDTYFEEYCAATPITIPQDFMFWDENERCVLKIHGSISNPSTIIATRDDYVKCAKNLNKGILGAKLKTILANQTVVFIGFSFKDEDFAQILKYLTAEMKDVMPHIYIITLDDQLSKKLTNKNATCIVTDGTYFLHQLKLILRENKLIVNCGARPTIKIVYNVINELHQRIATINFHKYPCVIYCLAYQDGIMHAFDRFMQLYNKGDYNIPGEISETSREYGKIVHECFEAKNYWDGSYYEGYLNGLILIGSCEETPNVVKHFPLLYLPDARCTLKSYDAFLKELKRVTKKADKYYKYALSLTERFKEPDTVVHHPPY